MALVTLRIVDGVDRGRVYEDLPTPITVGREEGNVVRLSDERVSRFHLKIQEDRNRIVLTDLASTNGTRVNGEPVQVAEIRPGDLITLGKTVILVGSRQQIAQRLAELRKRLEAERQKKGKASPEEAVSSSEWSSSWYSPSLDSELHWEEEAESLRPIAELIPPEFPRRSLSRSTGPAGRAFAVFPPAVAAGHSHGDGPSGLRGRACDARPAAVAESAGPVCPAGRVSPRDWRAASVS